VKSVYITQPLYIAAVSIYLFLSHLKRTTTATILEINVIHSVFLTFEGSCPQSVSSMCLPS